MTKSKPSTLKAQVAALYRIDPILWAVVKGYDTPEKIQARLDWTPERTRRNINLAIQAKRIKHWADKLRPYEDAHKILRRRLLR